MSDDTEEELYEHFRFEIDKGQGPVRLDKFLKSKIPYISRNSIQKSTKAKSVLVNNAAVKPHYQVKPADIITVVFHKPPREKGINPEEIPLEIIFEDQYLLVINKTAGMVVHPSLKYYSGTLMNALLAHFNNFPVDGQLAKPGLVHRIDKETSGLMVIAKEKRTMQALYEQFYYHTIKRKYIALVWGNFSQEKGTITGKLVKDLNSKNYINYPKHPEGKEAVTHYQVIKKFKGLSLIVCTLETGRTHQIRAQMKYAGHPLFSDTLYGGSKIRFNENDEKFLELIENCFKILPRQALHASSLGFIHPITHREIYFETSLPDDMQSVIDLLAEDQNADNNSI
jgi:23S rRNA pseudouridine1911/1915/1917 synthase